MSECRTAPKTDFDKVAFVRSCLAALPKIRHADMQRRAEEIGQTISPASSSEVRKAFESQAGILSRLNSLLQPGGTPKRW